jgi:predicted RNA-binding protein with RPS1 domain
VPGTQFTGRIVRSTDFGYFVEVEPGVDGLVHVSQLPHGVKPGDAEVAIGTSVQGWVREVDPANKRLSLSLRAVAVNDPWETAWQRYGIGRVVEGTVDHRAAPGVFVELEPGLTGLIPNSEINVAPGQDASQVHRPGEKLMVRIMSLDSQRKRISLSHEAAKAAAEREEYMAILDGRDENISESAMALAFRRAMERKAETGRAAATEVAQAQRVLVASVVATNSEAVESALRERLSYRAWLLEWRVGDPFRVILPYPEALFQQDLPRLIVEGRLRVTFNLGPFVLLKHITDVNRVALLAHYPSGAVRGLSAELSVTGSTINVTLVDPLALLDPDSVDLQTDKLGMISALADIVAVEEIE